MQHKSHPPEDLFELFVSLNKLNEHPELELLKKMYLEGYSSGRWNMLEEIDYEMDESEAYWNAAYFLYEKKEKLKKEVQDDA